jgi:hypothetical protein
VSSWGIGASAALRKGFFCEEKFMKSKPDSTRYLSGISMDIMGFLVSKEWDFIVVGFAGFKKVFNIVFFMGYEWGYSMAYVYD